MDLKNCTINNQKNQPDRREGCSLPSGGNRKSPPREFDRQLERIYSRTKSRNLVYKEIISNQWKENFQPKWFVTLLWNDLPTRSEVVSSHARHFRNVFLTSLLDTDLKHLPEPPARPHLIFFHERKPVIIRGRQIIAYHTHLHLGPLPDHQNHLWYLDHLIHQKVAPRVQKLLKSRSKDNEGVVIKPWIWNHHAFYNLKDYYRYQHHQDPDLILDYLNSDLKF